jgi:hypothetical protein
MAYRNRWDASDQIPERLVQDGTLTRFGQVDSTLGGAARRFSLSGQWSRSGQTSAQHVDLYAVFSDLDLYSNFTYRLADPVNGDQLHQQDRRSILGAGLRHQQALGRHTVSAGLATRLDRLHPVALYHSVRRERIGTVRRDEVTVWANGGYASIESRWSRWLRSRVGARLDLQYMEVESDRQANSGTRSDILVSPSASIAVGPWARTEAYLSGGFGFHSNDARGATITVDPVTGEPVEQVDPLVRSRGAEIGFRSNPVRRWRSTLTLWLLELDSELLFVGDAGTTEPSERSRRWGITWANFWRATSRLTLDLDVSLTRARFVGVDPGIDRVPGALEHVVAAGVAWAANERGPFGSVRLRHFGAFPLTEDNAVRAPATSLINASVGYLVAGLRITMSLLNVLDAVESDIRYFYASRLAGEPSQGVEDVHFHPVEPRQIRFGVAYGF